MDEFAIENEIPSLHEIRTIDVAVNGMKEDVFTWGGLAIRRAIGNRNSNVALNRKKSADAIVPQSTFGGRYGGRAEQQYGSSNQPKWEIEQTR